MVAITHAYHLADSVAPTLVIGNAPVYPDRIPAPSVGALSWLVRRRWGRPVVPDQPIDSQKYATNVAGERVTVELISWADRHICHCRFRWRRDRWIDIASWDHPLDQKFLDALTLIDP